MDKDEFCTSKCKHSLKKHDVDLKLVFTSECFGRDTAVTNH